MAEDQSRDDLLLHVDHFALGLETALELVREWYLGGVELL